MRTENILHADVLDIIFEHRNKNYGAYTLRKFYNNTLYKAIGAVCMLVLVCCLFSFFQKENKQALVSIIYEDPELKSPVHDPLPKKPKQPERHTPAPAKTGLQKTLSHVQITKDKFADPRDSMLIGNIQIAGIKGPVAPVSHYPVMPLSRVPEVVPPTVSVPPIDKNKPSDFAEVMPLYPGGTEALRKFLEKNLKTPESAESGLTVSVKMRFVVGFDGALKSFETIQDGGAEYNNEVIRVLKKMPQWIPGKTKGENVSVYFTLPVKFTAVE